MKYFTAIYQMPVTGLEEWMSKSADDRKAEEEKMQGEWNAWSEAHKSSVMKTIALGKTKSVSSDGVKDTKNGMMLSSYVEGESLEAVAEIFKNHPHLQIHGAFIEIMETREM